MVEHVRHTKTAQQLRLLSDALDSGRLGPVRRLVNILSPAEIGNLLESLPAAKRNIVWGLVDPEDDGEVLVQGPNVMRGYWREPAATAAALAGGWLHTGDIGRIEADGALVIVDRKKDFLKTAGADMIAPQPI